MAKRPVPVPFQFPMTAFPGIRDEGFRRAIAIGEALADVAWEASECPDCHGARAPCGTCDADGYVDCCVTCGASEARARVTSGPRRGTCGECAVQR